MNQELKRHLSTLERSNEEHKRLVRKREKEVDQMKAEFEQNITNATSLNHKVGLEMIFSFRSWHFYQRSQSVFLVYETRRRDQCSASWKCIISGRTETDTRQRQSMSRGATAFEERLRSSIEFHSRRHSWIVVKHHFHRDLIMTWVLYYVTICWFCSPSHITTCFAFHPSLFVSLMCLVLSFNAFVFANLVFDGVYSLSLRFGISFTCVAGCEVRVHVLTLTF